MMNIYVANKKSKLENIQKKYPSAIILDVTSTSKYGGLRVLSPFYPHGNIPIPGMPDRKATCVEAVWQGLKVFEDCGVDYATFRNDTMKDIKRSVRKYGKPLGHKYGDRLLNYEDARWMIYLPTYLYVLENEPTVRNTLEKIREKLQECDVVFLDYNTNCDLLDYSKPLSHAGLVKLYLEGKYPSITEKEQFTIANQSAQYQSINEIIDAITRHKLYLQKEAKYAAYIQKMKSFSKINWKEISDLSGKKRDGWKKLIKEMQNRGQLSLFD